jgi:hypothetical protein
MPMRLDSPTCLTKTGQETVRICQGDFGAMDSRQRGS